ncbi:MAG: Nif3-like dinuclear metal center hexameric protein, partial [Lachnospiraceae bacterium]|nr:Nif3-like dinuclear metal center hexameric protein [Lachnospiraceae bacterium]
ADLGGNDMTEAEAIRLFKCLADKSRLQILKSLAVEDMYVERLAERLGLTDTEVLEETGTWNGKPCGIGKVGSFEGTLENCAAFVKERFYISELKLFGDLERRVRKLAISPGSGKSEIAHAVSKGADVLITGDIDHHSGIDAVAQGLCIIDAGHYGLEHIFVEYMAEYLRRMNPELTVLTREQIPPFVIV